MIVYFLTGLTLGFSAAAQPGPFQAYLLSQVTRNGWRATLPAALAPLISDGPIIVLMVLVLSQMPAGMMTGITVAGSIFIFYLAWQALQGFLHPVELRTDTADTRTQSVVQAAVMNALSPGPYLFWGLLGGRLLLEAWQQSAGHAAGFMMGMYSTLLGGFAILIYIFGRIGALGPQANRWLSGISAVALAGFGGWQLWILVQSWITAV